MTEILRGIVTLLILAMVSVFILSVVLDKRPFVEQITTIFVFASLLVAAKLDAIIKKSSKNPLCMCLFFTCLFVIELAGVLAIALNSAGDETIVLKLWFQIDILIAVITFVAVLYHIMLICGGGGGSRSRSSVDTAGNDEFVAINIRPKSALKRPMPKINRMPGAMRKGMKIGAKRFNGLAF